MTESLTERAQRWADDDPDPATRALLLRALNNGDDLGPWFGSSLSFGTAGLRGILGPGPNCMNRVTVIRTTAGLCAWLKESVPNAAERGVNIGYDGRLMSEQFAADVAEVVSGAGLKARTFSHVVPTPLLGFSVLRQKAAAGVMITASHNPPAYNGYKVFWENGAQIIAPHDQEIAKRIADIRSIDDVSRGSTPPESLNGLEQAYLDALKTLPCNRQAPRTIVIAYTALHGVGQALAFKALRDAGFGNLHAVAEQAEPDGTFPTVAFPNPEEPGAMDKVVALGHEVNADLVIANDPDADRLAVRVKHAGDYRELDGNQIGCLLAHYLLEHGPKTDRRLVLSTIVSSPMLAAIADHHGARYEQTLTGHKWIHNQALALERQGYTYTFGYEEALGYAATAHVRDKDGISAAVLIADAAAWCATQGRTLIDELQRMWSMYGLFLSKQVSVKADTPAAIAVTMDGLRTNAPKSIGGHAVVAVSDLLTGTRTDDDGRQSEIGLPVSNVLVFELAHGHRAMVRPSGTEPKIKYYFDAKATLSEPDAVDSARASAEQVLETLADDLVD